MLIIDRIRTFLIRCDLQKRDLLSLQAGFSHLNSTSTSIILELLTWTLVHSQYTAVLCMNDLEKSTPSSSISLSVDQHLVIICRLWVQRCSRHQAQVEERTQPVLRCSHS